MQDSAVVDSSIVVALLVPEKYSIWAEDVIRRIERVYVLDLTPYEVYNALWKKYRVLAEIANRLHASIKDLVSLTASNICLSVISFLNIILNEDSITFFLNQNKIRKTSKKEEFDHEWSHALNEFYEFLVFNPSTNELFILILAYD